MNLFTWIRSLFAKKTKSRTVLFIRGEIGSETSEPYTMKAPTYDEVEIDYDSTSNVLMVELKKVK